MINKKFVLTVMVSTILAVGIPMVYAGSSNDLLRMDIKKSSAQDTVDVTFYTTGTPTNSVVTRKSGNSYVVLLPNVAGSQSVVPSLGGVKDLVSDISVKKVDDGIGGYTKITFNTTKPVRILTSTKQTAPLTSAQQDYKNLIAQSSNIKPINNTSNTKSASQKTTAPAVKQTPAVQTATAQKPVPKKTTTPTQSPQKQAPVKIAVSVTPATTVKPETKANNQAKATKSVKSENQVKSTEKTQKAKTVKADTKVKETPKTETKVNSVKAVKPAAKEPVAQKQPVKTSKTVSKPVTNKKAKSDVKKSKKIAVVPLKAKKPVKLTTETSGFNNPIVPVAGAFCLFGIFLLAGLAHIITKGVEDKRNRLLEYLEEQAASKTTQVPSPEFQAIMDDKESNWQEKYRKYTKLNESNKKKLGNKKNISYVANVKTSKGMIVPDEQLAKNKMHETISKMEHSLAQTPVAEPAEDYSNKYKSEDNAILNKMTEVKLKSFAPSMNLSETTRNLVSFDDLANRKKKTLKEGKFVNMNDSLVSKSKRKSLSSGMNFANIVRSGESYVPVNNEAVKQQEEYVLSSINEYMNLLDDEKSAVPMLQKPQEVSRAIDSAVAGLASSRAMATNPMISQRKSILQRPQTTTVNGLTVKSNYTIDSQRSIYMVDLDGISAIIGKIGEEVFVLKKFDKVINKPMQVRLDYGNTYIVRVGAFKCLVDVTENKMGTLLEI